MYMLTVLLLCGCGLFGESFRHVFVVANGLFRPVFLVFPRFQKGRSFIVIDSGLEELTACIRRSNEDRGRIKWKGTLVTSRPDATVSSLSLLRGVVGSSGVLQSRQFENVVAYARHNL